MMSARDRLQRNREAGDCQLCHTMGHIAEKCDLAECTKCEGRGHVASNCPTNHGVREVSLLLPHTMAAMLGATTRCIRDRHILPMMPYLDEWREVSVRDTIIAADGNKIKLSCAPTSTIALSIQELNGICETLVRIHPRRVKIAGKFVIENGELVENIAGKASGGTYMNSADADVHILLLLETFDGQTVGLTVNGTRFVMNWRNKTEQGHVRKLVHVSTIAGYEAAKDLRLRPAIPSLKEYFDGQNYARPGHIQLENDAPAAEANNIRAEEAATTEIMGPESTVEIGGVGETTDEIAETEAVDISDQASDESSVANGAEYVPLVHQAVAYEFSPVGNEGAVSLSATPTMARVVHMSNEEFLKMIVQDELKRQYHGHISGSQSE